jgi:hypothetical protein
MPRKNQLNCLGHHDKGSTLTSQDVAGFFKQTLHQKLTLQGLYCGLLPFHCRAVIISLECYHYRFRALSSSLQSAVIIVSERAPERFFPHMSSLWRQCAVEVAAEAVLFRLSRVETSRSGSVTWTCSFGVHRLCYATNMCCNSSFEFL